MKEYNDNMRLKRLVHPPKHNTANSPRILRTFAIMTLHIGVNQETMDITDTNDAIIPIEIIKIISETAHYRLIASEIRVTKL